MSTELLINGEKITLDAVERAADNISFTYNGVRHTFNGTRHADGSFTIRDGHTQHNGTVWPSGKGVSRIALGMLEVKVSPVMTFAAAMETPLAPLAPMPGIIRQVLVQKGDRVTKGQPLAVMEAMKLQTTLAAGGDAVVQNVLVKVGELVSEGAELFTLTPVKS